MRPPYCRRTKQSGYVLVLSVILLGLFLSLAAAAIDMGNLYVWQLRLDKAARAGALAGIGYRATKGWQTIHNGPPDYANPHRDANASPAMAALLDIADKAVRDTFKVSFPASRTDWASVEATVQTNLKPCNSAWVSGNTLLLAAPTAYDPKEDKIDLYYQYQVPTFFAGRLKGLFGSFPMCDQNNGTGCLIKTHQTAQLDYANIIMLLDVSGSMVANKGQLIASAEKFYQMFNPFRDRISLIEFNLGARTVFGFNDQMDSSDRDELGYPKGSFGKTDTRWNQFTGAIRSLQPQSNTNPCEALSLAMTEITALQTSRGLTSRTEVKPFLVFFTDGAPNAFRGNFQNMKNWSMNGNPVNPSTDWYQYAIEWIDASKTPSTYQGPSPLIKPQISLFNFAPQATDPYTNSSTFTNGNDYCGDIWSDPANFETALNAALNPTPSTRRPGCLNTLDFSIPNGSGRVISLPITVSNETDFRVGNVQKYLELPYYCAIEAADQIRADFGGTIFAIGLGSQAGDPQCNDPLQDPTNYFVRKDNFLSRLAFDPFTVQGANWKDTFQFSPRRGQILNDKCVAGRANNTIPVGYDLSGTGTANPRTPSSLGSTNGQYYPTDDPDVLPSLFAQVAKQILLRLNS